MGANPPLVARGGAIVLFLLAAATYSTGREIALAGRIGFPLDDSWIHATLARSLAEGSLADQATFQVRLHPAEPPVAASTAPLWTFLESLAMRLTLAAGDPGDPTGEAAIAAAKALGLLFGAASCLLAAALARRITGSAWIGLAAGALLAVQPRFLWGVLSGLEVPLYVALALAGVLAHVDWRDAPGWRRHAPIALFSLAGFARPECFLLVPIHVLDALLFGPREHRRPAALARTLLLAAAVVAPYPALHLMLGGRPLPTTFYVKGEAGSVFAKASQDGLLSVPAFFATNLLNLSVGLLAFLPALFLPLLPAFVRGCRRLLRRGAGGATILPFGLLAFLALHAALAKTDPTVQSGRRLFVFPVLYLLTAAAGLVADSRVRAPGRGVRRGLLAGAAACAGVAGWALLPLPPAPALAALRYFYTDIWGGLDPDLYRRAADHLPRVRDGLAMLHLGAGLLFAALPLPAKPLLARALVVLAIAQSLLALPGAAGAYARNVRDTFELNVATGKWIRDHLPPDARIAVHDLGAIAYFGRRRVLDLEGIGSPRALPYRRRGAAGLAEILRLERPDTYAGAPGGLQGTTDDYVAAFRTLPFDPKPLFHRFLQENVTVAGGEVVVARFNW